MEGFTQQEIEEMNEVEQEFFAQRAAEEEAYRQAMLENSEVSEEGNSVTFQVETGNGHM